jgi:ethanolamine transporter EutH
MTSTAENKNQVVMSGVIATAPINVLMFSHLSTEAPLFNTANLTIFLSGVIASTICGITSAKVVQNFVEKGRTNAMITGACIGSTLGASVFVVLSEVVKQFQQ